MSRLPSLPCCVEPRLPDRHRLSTPDVVVIVVITVLASMLAVGGLPPSAILDVLGVASVVALGVLVALRGGSRLSHLVIRGMQVSSPV
ncbi:hypothetical protein [Streptomyces sp. B15]|uniref:hypothetical protein n=1 Tax=Streptomyces sp. B15 TaxID=1537797 RepID=UPI001B38E597|nr:hypothetical protein [Streptomyces sp. B15]MBQ1122982.1 hypothetical protein [Streptomyces sp. B15]